LKPIDNPSTNSVQILPSQALQRSFFMLECSSSWLPCTVYGTLPSLAV
jgi:hypothetical protein